MLLFIKEVVRKIIPKSVARQCKNKIENGSTKLYKDIFFFICIIMWDKLYNQVALQLCNAERSVRLLWYYSL